MVINSSLDNVEIIQRIRDCLLCSGAVIVDEVAEETTTLPVISVRSFKVPTSHVVTIDYNKMAMAVYEAIKGELK